MSDGADPGLLRPGGKFGDYTVERLLGSGGMGAVYLIRGDSSGNEFAVKILDPAMEKSDPEFKQRFIFEAELAMSVRHENLIQVFDVGRDPETGYGYILMEYVPGGTVRDRLMKWGALSVEEAGDIVRRVARALAAVAAHHVVHRDVKPDNIMFTADGVTPKLADLGIARLSNERTRRIKTITEHGFIIGSPAYMSPEQMEDAHLADIRSDIHALGITFWEMLAGRRPYEGEDALATVARVMKGEPVPDIRRFRADVPAGIASLIARMTRPNVAERIQTPEEVADELDSLLQGGNRANRRLRIPSRRELAALRHAARTRQRANKSLRLGLALFAAAVVVGVAGLVMLVWAVHSSVTAAPAAVTETDPLVVLTPEPAPPEPAVIPESEPEAASGDSVASVSEPEPETKPSPEPPPKPSPKPPPKASSKPAVAAAAWTETIAPELRRYAMYRRMATVAETRAEAWKAVLKAVNDARMIDPDMRIYDLDGTPNIPGREVLSPSARATLRTGKIFLALELTRADVPKLMARYAQEKIAATAKLSKPRVLSADDVVALLGRAAKKDLFPLFRELGVKADPRKTVFHQGGTK